MKPYIPHVAVLWTHKESLRPDSLETYQLYTCLISTQKEPEPPLKEA